MFSSRPIRVIRPRGKKRGFVQLPLRYRASFWLRLTSSVYPRKTFLRLILNTGNFKLGGKKYRRGASPPSSRYIAIRGTETVYRHTKCYTIYNWRTLKLKFNNFRKDKIKFRETRNLFFYCSIDILTINWKMSFNVSSFGITRMKFIQYK